MSKKYTTVPAITGVQLVWLLEKDGWTREGRAKHGVTLAKKIGERRVVTFAKDTNESIPPTTLGQILGVKQTGLGKPGLLRLINEYGLP